MFSPLTIEQMEEIVVLQLKEVQDRLNEHNISVQLTDAARAWLAKEGYDPAFGARPLRRAIQKYVESPLSVELLGGKFKDGAVVDRGCGREGKQDHLPHRIGYREEDQAKGGSVRATARGESLALFFYSPHA
jgi:ATP-dependent Clp protease ATP-binding subunit ClpA